MQDKVLYKHVKTGNIFEHIDNYENFKIFKDIHFGYILYINFEFDKYYKKIN